MQVGQPELASRFRHASWLFAVLVVLGGVIVLAGWVLEIRRLVEWIFGRRPAQLTSAVAAIAAAMALLQFRDRQRPGMRVLVKCLGAITLASGSMVLVARVSGMPPTDWSTARAGKLGIAPDMAEMAVMTAVAYVCVGASVLSLGRVSWATVQQLFALIAGAIAIFSLLTHMYGLEHGHGIEGLMQLSFANSVLMLLLASSAILAQPQCGLVQVAASNTLAGLMLRRIVPASLLLPLLLGYLRILGQERGVFSFEFGVTLLVFACTAGMLVTAVVVARSLYDADLERAEAQEKLAMRAEELARSNADLEQFAYIASHDLQEPLRAASGYIQLLERKHGETLDDKGRHYIREAVEAIKRMQTLINNLLEYSRIGRRGKPFVLIPAAKLVDSALRTLRRRMEEAGAEVTVGTLPEVEVDEGQMVQVFENLIANAIKFRSPSRPPRVSITAEIERDATVFAVSDNGIGIEPQYEERVFAVFQRLHTRAEYPGTGIGLAICRKIVERHGGTIWLGSRPGEGTTFKFRLPTILHRETFGSPRSAKGDLGHVDQRERD